MSRQLADKATLDKLDRSYAMLFATPDGEKVLADLRELFYDCEIKGDLERAVGRRDTVHYILEAIKHGS